VREREERVEWRDVYNVKEERGGVVHKESKSSNYYVLQNAFE
jgi:hypothetical protein